MVGLTIWGMVSVILLGTGIMESDFTFCLFGDVLFSVWVVTVGFVVYSKLHPAPPKKVAKKTAKRPKQAKQPKSKTHTITWEPK